MNSAALPKPVEVFRYRLELSRWPLVVIPGPGDRPAEQIDVDSFYAELDALLARDTPIVVLHDIRGMRRDASVRKRFANWIDANGELLSRNLIAYALLLDSKLQRGIITAVLWLTRPRSPTRAFTDRDAAEAWLLDRYVTGRGAPVFIPD